ncbi:hypothetical protein FJY94_08085 [Candidatus Kaiserbacteria bacterium]|nr:hypothetical protein [Candidatus Kaiserbacteria bacterium]
MKPPIGHAGGQVGDLPRIGRRPPANAEALKVLEEVAAWVRAHPEADRLVVLAGSPGQCRPFTTSIDNPLDFIGLLEVMKHELFREN